MSNTESAQTQWKAIANTLGYPDEPQMWHGLYNIEEGTIEELSKRLGFGTATIARRLEICGIEKRKRGGANNPSRILQAVAHLDQRAVRLSTPDEIAHLVGSSVHSIYRVLKEL